MANETLRQTPNQFRARAQSAASLVASLVAVVATGTILGGASNLTREGAIAAVVSIILLAFSVGCFVAAFMYSKSDEVEPDQLEGRVREIVSAIRRRSSAGLVLLLAATVGLLVVVWSSATSQRTTVRVAVTIEDDRRDNLLGPCHPQVAGQVRGETSQSDLNQGTQTLRIRTLPGECGQLSKTVYLRWDDIARVTEID